MVLPGLIFAVTLQWDPTPVEYDVTYYLVRVDNSPLVMISAGNCSTSMCEYRLNVTEGWHTFGVSATNKYGTSDETVVTQELRDAPSPPRGLRIVK